MKKILVGSVCAASLLANSGLVVFAQTATPTPFREVREAEREGLKKEAEKVREELKSGQIELRTKAAKTREGLKKERAALRAGTATPEEMKVAREESQRKAEAAREELKMKREELRDRMEAAREELKSKREAQKEELKARLEQVKDARKKEATERLDEKFANVNEKLTTTWANALNRFDELLVKVASRADKAASAGADVSATRTAIEKAKTAITAARTAVTAQAAKTYPIAVTSEDALRSAVAQTREKLNQDLKAVRELVQAAHRATVDALTSLKRVPKVDEVNGEATTTPEAPSATTSTTTP